MPPLSRRRRLVGTGAALFAVVLLAAACNDGSGTSTDAKGPDRTTTTSRTESGSTTTAPAGAATSSTAPPLTPAPVDSCGDQAQFIVEAAEQSGDPAVAGATGQYRAEHCRLSQSELIWAVVDLVPNPGSSFTAQPALMERIGATWIIHSAGSLESCDAPPRARTELGLTCNE